MYAQNKTERKGGTSTSNIRTHQGKRPVNEPDKSGRCVVSRVIQVVALRRIRRLPPTSSLPQPDSTMAPARERKIWTSVVANALWTRSFCHRAALLSTLEWQCVENRTQKSIPTHEEVLKRVVLVCNQHEGLLFPLVWNWSMRQWRWCARCSGHDTGPTWPRHARLTRRMLRCRP